LRRVGFLNAWPENEIKARCRSQPVRVPQPQMREQWREMIEASCLSEMEIGVERRVACRANKDEGDGITIFAWSSAISGKSIHTVRITRAHGKIKQRFRMQSIESGPISKCSCLSCVDHLSLFACWCESGGARNRPRKKASRDAVHETLPRGGLSARHGARGEIAAAH